MSDLVGNPKTGFLTSRLIYVSFLAQSRLGSDWEFFYLGLGKKTYFLHWEIRPQILANESPVEKYHLTLSVCVSFQCRRMCTAENFH